MPQISKKKLDNNFQEEIYSQFWIALSKLNNSNDVSQFYSDFLTETEKIMFTPSITYLNEKKLCPSKSIEAIPRRC